MGSFLQTCYQPAAVMMCTVSMGRKAKSPPEKKQDSYKRDRYVVLDAPHAFRKNWPKKKARAEQAYRQTTKRILGTVAKAPEIAEIAENALKSLKRKDLVKSGRMRLREWLDSHEYNRISRAIRHRFGSPGYVLTLAGRSKAAAFLRALMLGAGARESLLFAQAFREAWLSPPEGNCNAIMSSSINGVWRIRDGPERVFEEYPQLQQEFEQWLATAAGDKPR
jgi:hypothetical protein